LGTATVPNLVDKLVDIKQIQRMKEKSTGGRNKDSHDKGSVSFTKLNCHFVRKKKKSLKAFYQK